MKRFTNFYLKYIRFKKNFLLNIYYVNLVSATTEV